MMSIKLCKNKISVILLYYNSIPLKDKGEFCYYVVKKAFCNKNVTIELYLGSLFEYIIQILVSIIVYTYKNINILVKIIDFFCD